MINALGTSNVELVNVILVGQWINQYVTCAHIYLKNLCFLNLLCNVLNDKHRFYFKYLELWGIACFLNTNLFMVAPNGFFVYFYRNSFLWAWHTLLSSTWAATSLRVSQKILGSWLTSSISTSSKTRYQPFPSHLELSGNIKYF